MTYELAKELKDAGFIQNYRCACPDCKGIDGDAYPPTLSELIKACDDYFDSMYRGSDSEWLAESVLWDAGAGTDSKKNIGQGKTPEEAVARLWLALNKK